MQNLDNRTPITNPDGSPTEYFMRLLQGHGGLLEDAGDQIDRLDAEVSALLARQIIAGDGLDGGGPLSSNVTLTADVQEILDQITVTQGYVLYRAAGGWAALPPGTTGQVLQTNGAGADPAWANAAGGGGIYVRPSVVQYASSCANSGSVTFAAPVTPGNLLICVASHYNNVTNFTSGWSILLNRNVASTDGNLVATKIADSDDSTVISVFGGVAGSNMTIFEVQDSLGVVVLPWRDIQGQVGSSTTTLRVGIPNDKCLLVGAFSTVSANTAPTSVTGATAGTTVTGTSTSASPRQITPYVNNTVTKGSQTVTATYAATPRSYGYAVVALPSI